MIDHDRDRFGVEPMCRVLDVSASAYYQRAGTAHSTARSSGPTTGDILDEVRGSSRAHVLRDDLWVVAVVTPKSWWSEITAMNSPPDRPEHHHGARGGA